MRNWIQKLGELLKNLYRCPSCGYEASYRKDCPYCNQELRKVH
jgi:rubrerythrin